MKTLWVRQDFFLNPKSEGRGLKTTLALVFFLTLHIVSGLAPARGSLQESQPPPYRWPRSRNYDVQHYRIALGFDWAQRSVAGATTITLRPFESGLKEIELDAGRMSIKSVVLDGGAPLKFRYEDDEKIFVQLDRSYPAERDLSIKIEYSAVPEKGLTFITPTQADPTAPYQIWSQGEAEDNHYWFPCYDYPNDKATSELIATVEEKYEVISNGALLSVERDPIRKTRTWHWRMDKPYSTYLTSIIVGEFAQVIDRYKGTPVISYVYRDQVENARLSFAKTARMLAHFSERLAFDYPYAKYAQTTVRNFSGGMENITATTLTDTAVHDERAHLDVSSDELVAHEIAHSWFGNMLTCRDWSDLWLNESFATLFESVWAEHELGRDDYLYDIYHKQQTYFRSWFQGNRRPVVSKRYGDPDGLFDTYPYERGAAVLNMMRFVLGEELFWKAVRHYVKKHQWQNVGTEQLVTAIEEATGHNLQWFIDEWVLKMGHPEFEVESSYDGAGTLKLKVTQVQKPDTSRPWQQWPDLFTMPVDIAITTASGEKIHRVWVDEREEEFSFEVTSKPLIINFDRGNHLIKQVRFKRTDEELAYRVRHDADVMGRVRSAIELKARRSDAAATALAEAALRDRFWGVRLEAVRALSEFKTNTARAALIEAARDADSRIRCAAMQGLAAFKDPRLAGLFIKVINTDRSYFTVAEAAEALGQTSAPGAYDTLASAVAQDSWQDITRRGALAGLASLNDPRAVEVGLKYGARGNSPQVRLLSFRLLAEVGKGNEKVLSFLLEALKEENRIALEAIESIQNLGDMRAVPALGEFSQKSGLSPSTRQLIDKAINRLKEAGK